MAEARPKQSASLQGSLRRLQACNGLRTVLHNFRKSLHKVCNISSCKLHDLQTRYRDKQYCCSMAQRPYRLGGHVSFT